MRPIAGKGVGVVATQRILAGGKILEETPLVKGPGGIVKETFQTYLKELSNIARQKVLGLYNAFPEDKEVGILITNRYGLGPEGELCGLFEKLSRVNHSCQPNCERCWDHEREVETLYALRCVEAGEELTVAYFDGSEMTRAERQGLISASWRFECMCECCSLTGAALGASEERRTFLKSLSRLLPNIPPHKLFDLVKKALRLMDEEGLLGSPKALMCGYAYQMALSMRNVEDAKSFAEAKYRQYLLATGSNSRWTKEMLDQVRNPSCHRLWNPVRSRV
jgi:hypothetical protein